MFKKITLSLCCLVVHTLTAQTNNCSTNPLALQYYTEDIRSLAHEYMWQTQQDTTAIQIPQQHFDFIASKLSAVMELNTAETDSVFNKYCVHDVREIPELKQFIVFIDSTQTWTHAWMNELQITGNPTIDNFMSAHNFTVIDHVELPYESSYGRHYVTIASPIVVNARGVVNWFKAQEGVLTAEQNITYGGAGRLFFYQDGNQSYLSFIHEWSDCGDGCDNMIQWIYAVDQNCSASLFNRSEFHVWDTWPEAPETNCNIALGTPDTATVPSLALYPNPVYDVATLEVTADLVGTTVTVHNTLGQTIKTLPINNTTVTVDLSSLPAGVYYLSTDNRSRTVTLVKR
ncbi:T9SS type A sorting domain-containing protein [Flavobacterium sedimenticola]|uniref:T9SS type A sorting domain-containing protein n=1 Tax=Flavobacterium sedimenticola TaxID=3043286 RepID=A0ABT6XSY1_9FLAO|nr:T9SS type A sorting domain-containing protein [Flavobacterium sedimenticola]MDI9258166.1 T9SS type A sorting domain-containing protein [Flavobacterium sedimenticola]